MSDPASGRLRTFLLAAVTLVSVAAYAAYQSRAILPGLGFAAALGIALGLLAGLGWLLRGWARRVAAGRRSFVVRQATANLYRPGNTTLILVVTLGLGTALMATQQFAVATLLGPLRLPPIDRQPDLVLVDVQSDQRDATRQLIRDQGVPLLHEVPIVPMRLARLRGRSVGEWMTDPASRIPDWTLKREYRSTYRNHAVDTETRLDGAWPAEVVPGHPVPVSVERDLARDLGIGMGDRVVFDVQGVEIEAAIAHVREVDWKSMQPNFFFVFPEGVLESAPQTFAFFTRTASADASARLQRAVATTLPTLSCIDLSSVLDAVRTLLERTAKGLNGLTAFTLVAGLIVLIGAVRASRRARRRESLLLRTLGASTPLLVRLAAAEFGMVCAIASLAGIVLALPASAALAVWVFKSPWRVDLPGMACLLAGLMAAGVLLGGLDSFRLLRRTPLSSRRREVDP